MEILYIIIIILISLGISMLLTAKDMDKDETYLSKLSSFQISSIFIFRFIVCSLYLVFIMILIQSI